MATFTFQTSLTLNQEGNTTPDIVDPFRNALKAVSGGAFDVDPLTLVGSGEAYANVLDGTTKFAFESTVRTTLPGDNLLFFTPFGMEIAEWFSWWYEEGAALHRTLTDAEGINLIMFPIAHRAAESGGWFKEAMSLKKFEEGKYSDGDQLRLRYFGEAEKTMDLAFPNVQTPPPTIAVSPLDDIKNGTFNGVEFSEPFGDASPIAGMFPNWPAIDDSIMSAGLTHYYIASWHTPYRGRTLWVTKDWYDALTADEQAQIEVSARAATMSALAASLNGQDAIIKQFQTLGATIHRDLPADVNARLREAASDVLDAEAVADGTGNYQQILDSLRNYSKANAVRWASSTVDRRFRYQRNGWESDLVV